MANGWWEWARVPRPLHTHQRHLAKPGGTLIRRSHGTLVPRGSHTSVRSLETAMLGYLERRNKNPKPFVWTADANMILGKVER